MRILPILLLISPSTAFAGSCLEPIETYLAALEALKPDEEPPKNEDVEDPLRCLTVILNFLELGREEILERDEIARVRAERAPHAGLAERVLAPRLRAQTGQKACDTARGLATFGASAAFDGLEKCPPDVYTALSYGLLGDARAEPKLIDWFRGADQNYKKNRKLGFTVKLNLLNALVAIGGPKAKALVEELAQDERSPLKRFVPLAKKRLAN